MIPHEYYGHNCKPELKELGNEALMADPDYVANEAADQLPLHSTLGLGPKGDGVLFKVKESSDETGTFVVDFINAETQELIEESPNLHAGIISAEVNEDEHKITFKNTRNGALHTLNSISIPQGEHGTRIYNTQNNEPVPIQDDLTYEFNTSDLVYQGKKLDVSNPEQPLPRVWDIMFANVVGPNDGQSYFSSGLILDTDEEKTIVVFNILYRVSTQVQSNFLETNIDLPSYIKNRERIEDNVNKINDLSIEPADEKLYPNALSVYNAIKQEATTRKSADDNLQEQINTKSPILNEGKNITLEPKEDGTITVSAKDQEQADYSELDPTKLSYIKNRDKIQNKLNSGEYIAIKSSGNIDVTNFTTDAEVDALFSTTKKRGRKKIKNDFSINRINSLSRFKTHIDTLLNAKSPKLVAGDGIKLVPNADGTITVKATGIDTWDGLRLTAQQDNSTVSYTISGGVDINGIQYSYNGKIWHTWAPDEDISLLENEYINVRNTNNTLSIDSSNYFMFSMTGKIAASGNVNSMINFSSLTDYCFYGMFSSCPSLVAAPELPATILAESCYYGMFEDCALTIAPNLPATTLAESCYGSMFANCTSLIIAPHLPAITLVSGCYENMFNGCTSLKIWNGGFAHKILFFRCPSLDGLENPVTDMFKSTGGDITEDPTEGNSYFYKAA